MNGVIHTVDTGALVYHDGFAIQGISFAVDEDLATKFDYIVIPVDDAIRFVHGEMNFRHWFVWFDSMGPVLYHDKIAKMHLDRIDDHYVKLPLSTNKAGLVVRIYRDAPKLVFRVTPGIEFDSKFATMTFLFTKANDASAVMHVLDVSLTELLKEGLLCLPFPNHSDTRMDVFTRTIFPFQCVEYAEADDDLTFNLPHGHFVDLMRFSRRPVDQGLQASLMRSTGVMRLALAGSGVEKYARPMDHLRLLFSMPNDPTLLLYATAVPVAKIQDGVALKLPDILNQPFDLWCPLLYRHASIVEN